MGIKATNVYVKHCEVYDKKAVDIEQHQADVVQVSYKQNIVI